MTIYMKSLTEKEKKLSLALEKLKNLKPINTQEENLVRDLQIKNQLEIEKKDLNNKYDQLKTEYEQLSEKINHFENVNNDEKSKQKEFSEKIDELNQETDTLLEELDKWQM